MDDNISRQAALAYPLSWEHYDMEHGDRKFICGVESYREYIEHLPSTDRTGHWFSFEQVADMLSGMFGECACDVNGNDGWLPLACKYADTECPHPKEENGCWMQFLLQGGADMRGADDEET